MKYRKALLTCLGLILIACSGFPTSINNIEQDKKTRPLSVVLDKPEAAPGDTVQVTLNCYIPDTSAFSLTWQAALDYRLDMMSGKGVEDNIMSLDPVMFDDTLLLREDHLVTHRFRFVIPESTIIRASSIPARFPLLGIPPDVRLLLGLPAGADTLTRAEMDALLSGTSFDLGSPLIPAEMRLMLESMIDLFSCRIKFRVKIQSDITLDVVRTMTIRYSSRFNTAGTNKNPDVRGLALIKVQGETMDPDEIGDFARDTIYLYNRDHPALVQDTVVIDTGNTYFLEVHHDSGQVFYYMRETGGVAQVDSNREQYYYRWFFSNMDGSDMPQDSLIMLMTRQDACIMLPPVDTGMHHFRLYVVVRDDRAEWGALVSPGIAYVEAKGYFKYTEAFKKEAGRF